LVKIESNAETPQKIGEQEIVQTSPNECAQPVNVHNSPRRQDEAQIRHDNCHAQVHNQLDGVGSDSLEYSERNNHKEGAENGDREECRLDPSNYNVKSLEFIWTWVIGFIFDRL